MIVVQVVTIDGDKALAVLVDRVGYSRIGTHGSAIGLSVEW
jgi:hypothetical protein